MSLIGMRCRLLEVNGLTAESVFGCEYGSIHDIKGGLVIVKLDNRELIHVDSRYIDIFNEVK